MVMDAVARRHAERDVEAVGVPAGRQPEPTFHGRRDELEPTDQFGRFGAALRPEGPLNWKRRAAVALGLLILGIVLIVESIGKLQTTEVAIVYGSFERGFSIDAELGVQVVRRVEDWCGHAARWSEPPQVTELCRSYVWGGAS